LFLKKLFIYIEYEVIPLKGVGWRRYKSDVLVGKEKVRSRELVVRNWKMAIVCFLLKRHRLLFPEFEAGCLRYQGLPG
jgi:hypothetical protein